MTWFGWLWIASAQRWQRVCAGESLSQCHRRLSRGAKRWGVPDKHCCLAMGGPPSFVPQGFAVEATKTTTGGIIPAV
jgi:hypothetical protein